MASGQRKPRTLRQELRMLLVNPGATILLAFIVIYSAGSQPGRTPEREGTWIGRRHTSLPSFYRAGPYQRWGTETFFLLKEGDGFRTIDANRESWDELSKLVQDRPRDLFEVEYRCHGAPEGFWAVTRRGESRSIVIKPLAGSPTNEELAKARAEAAASLSRILRDDQSDLALADRTTSAIVWVGYLENGAILLSALAFCCSLAWIGPAWRFVRYRKSRSRIRRGLCPACGYPATGFECPECGRALSLQEKDPGTAPGS